MVHDAGKVHALHEAMKPLTAEILFQDHAPKTVPAGAVVESVIRVLSAFAIVFRRLIVQLVSVTVLFPRLLTTSRLEAIFHRHVKRAIIHL